MTRTVQFRPIALNRVSLQPLPDKPRQEAKSFVCAATEGRDRLNAAVDGESFQQIEIARERCQAFGPVPRHLSLGIGRGHKKPIEKCPEARGDGARRVLLLFEKLGGNNHIGIDRPQRHAQTVAGGLSPPLGFAQRVLIANHQTRSDLLAEPHKLVRWVAAKYKTDVTPAKAFREVGDSLGQEGVMTQISVGIERYQSGKNYNRFPQSIGRFDGRVESGIVDGSLRALHPVDDTRPLRVRRSLTPHTDAGILGEFV